MARKQMVTRTIVATKVNVMCLDIVKAEPFNTDIVLPGTFKTEKKLMEAVEELVNSKTEKAVHIMLQEEIETLYGMSEQDFINHAKVLDKETRKEIETADAEPVENN